MYVCIYGWMDGWMYYPACKKTQETPDVATV